MIKFEKSQHPIDCENRYQGWVKITGFFLEGTIEGTTFRHLPTFGQTIEIDLSDATEANVRSEWDNLNAQEETFNNWINQE